MKHIKFFTLAAAALMLFAGCKAKDVPLQCDVDPDEVFGQHYTAADFQLWYVLDANSETYHSMLNAMDVEDYEANQDFGMGLPVMANDTADIMVAAKVACEGVDSMHIYHPAWFSYPNEKQDVFYLAFLYGNNTPEGEYPLLDGSAIDNAKVTVNKIAGFETYFVFSGENADIWAKITGDGIGKCIAMTLGDRILTAPRVNGQVTDGRCSVTGIPTQDEACALSTILNSK